MLRLKEFPPSEPPPSEPPPWSLYLAILFFNPSVISSSGPSVDSIFFWSQPHQMDHVVSKRNFLSFGCFQIFLAILIKWSTLFPNEILAALAMNQIPRNPSKTRPLQSSEPPPWNSPWFLYLYDDVFFYLSAHSILSIASSAAIQGHTFLISVIISRFLGWLRSVLIWNLFLKPENSNMNPTRLNHIITSVASIVPLPQLLMSLASSSWVYEVRIIEINTGIGIDCLPTLIYWCASHPRRDFGHFCKWIRSRGTQATNSQPAPTRSPSWLRLLSPW